MSLIKCSSSSEDFRHRYHNITIRCGLSAIHSYKFSVHDHINYPDISKSPVQLILYLLFIILHKNKAQ